MILWLLLFGSWTLDVLSEPSCSPTVGYCSIFFNKTKLPNKFREDNYSKIVSIMMHYEALALSECHPHIDLLICATLFPACTPGYDITLPCNDFCEDVKKSCQPFIKKAQISWPFYFDCLGLPRKRRGRFCINNKFKVADLKKLKPPAPIEKVVPPIDIIIVPDPDEFTDTVVDLGLMLVTHPPTNRKDAMKYVACPEPVLFLVEEQNAARVWVMAWSCLAITLSFLMTFITMAYGKLMKPENILVTLNFYLLFQAIGFLMSVMNPQPAFQCTISENDNDPIYLKTTNPTPSCLIAFTSIYFTGIAANLWWVTLTLLWFLMLGLNWTEGSIFKVFRYLHLVIGGLAGGLTVTVLTLGAVEGDELSGGCFAGGIDPQNLVTYDITPNSVLLCIGGVVLFGGFCTLIKITKIDGYKHSMETSIKRLKKIAVFSLFYFLISLIKVLCQFYELMYRPEWYKDCDPNLRLANYNATNVTPDMGSCGPDYRIFLLKYTAYLILPILIAVFLRTKVSFTDIVKRLVPIAKGYGRKPNETNV